MSFNNAAVVRTEALMEAKDTKSPIFVTYMDTSKAFDTVNHCALHTQSVTGPIWYIYNNAYTDIRSVVKWEKCPGSSERYKVSVKA